MTSWRAMEMAWWTSEGSLRASSWSWVSVRQPSSECTTPRVEQSALSTRSYTCINTMLFKGSRFCSSPHASMALGANRWRRSSHVRFRWSADLRDDHQLHAILPGARRLLTSRRNGAIGGHLAHSERGYLDAASWGRPVKVARRQLGMLRFMRILLIWSLCERFVRLL
jgi:hypothetical protein